MESPETTSFRPPSAVDETIIMPRAVIVPGPRTPISQRELAARHGLTIAGQRPTLADYTRQIWRYRHFIATYANGRLIASFSTARLGRLWQVLTPLANAAIYYLIFGVLLNTRQGVPNFVAYLCTGLFVFTFTQTVVLSGVRSISGQLGLVRALYFPRACLPIAVMLTQLQSQLVASVVLMGIVVATGDPVTVHWLMLPPALLLQSIFNTGLALVVARLGAKLPDLRQLMPYVMRTWMYASGVFYSVEFFAAHLPAAAATALQANPLLVYIQLARHALLESPPVAAPTPRLWLLGVGWAILMCVGGYLFFWRGEQEYGRG